MTSPRFTKWGQFATPFELALSLARYAHKTLGEGGVRFLDPAIGTGSFYSALSQAVPAKSIEAATAISAKFLVRPFVPFTEPRTRCGSSLRSIEQVLGPIGPKSSGRTGTVRRQAFFPGGMIVAHHGTQHFHVSTTVRQMILSLQCAFATVR